MLRSKFFSDEQVAAIVRDYRTAGLAPREVAMLDFAVKLTDHAYKITPRDIEALRAQGFADEEIVDIAAAAALRSFVSKLVDALGAEPDPHVHALDSSLRQALDVGEKLEGSGR
ncbi:MAG TPA: hypothetical protein VNN19_00060 [bacterium]|nr:hypothetical protein [bacterium]